MNTTTDQELLVRHRSGDDPAALRELMARHASLVYATARRLAPADAEDVTQAVFVLLWQKAGKLAGMKSAAGWLYRAALYACRNANNVRGRREHYEREAAMLRRELSEADEPQVRALLDEGLARLGEANRQAVLLRYLEGLTVCGQTICRRGEQGVWKLDVEQSFNRDFAGAQMQEMVQIALPVVRKLTGDLNAGRITTAEQLRKEFASMISDLQKRRPQ
jgi:RNA polymerase sigma factor (sigma-70 family)